MDTPSTPSAAEWLQRPLLEQVAQPLAPSLPCPCFPELMEAILREVLEQEWSRLSSRAKAYLRWMSTKAEAIDVFVPTHEVATHGFELLAADRFGNSFGKIQAQCKELGIPSILFRFASLVAAFLNVRLLKEHLLRKEEADRPLVFTQNVDGDYLNYPRALRAVLDRFPEAQEQFYFEVNEGITEDYLNTIRFLSEELGLRLALDDTNRMDQQVHRELLDYADWIKIDFQGTAMLEARLKNGERDPVLWHLENYAKNSQTSAMVFEGLGEHSVLKGFLENHWPLSSTRLYHQSRERRPRTPWNDYFGVIQDHVPGEYGLFFKRDLCD